MIKVCVHLIDDRCQIKEFDDSLIATVGDGNLTLKKPGSDNPVLAYFPAGVWKYYERVEAIPSSLNQMGIDVRNPSTNN